MPSMREFLDTCFIQDWVDGTYLQFQLMPEDIQEQKSVNWNDVEIVGRPVPLKGYQSSAAKTFALQLTFVEDPGVSFVPRADIRSISRWLKSFTYPHMQDELGQGGFLSPPHPVYLQVANMIQMLAVITDVSISYRGNWNTANGFSSIIDANVTFSEIAEIPPGLHQIRGGRFAGGDTDPSIPTKSSDPVSKGFVGRL